MPRPSRSLRLGDVAPPFELPNAASDEVVALADLLRDRRGLLLVFHRGMW
jgi:hypothetical protein